MTYDFQLITQKLAEEIAFRWHYDGMYAFYDMEADKEDLEEFLDPVRRGQSTFAVCKDDDLVGYVTFHRVNLKTIELGLGMKPGLTGKGNGLEFLKAGIEFATDHFLPRTITLSVATFNQRAIKVYKRAGFKPIGTFVQETNGSRFEFMKMCYDMKN